MLDNLLQLLLPIMQRVCYSAKAESLRSRNLVMEVVRYLPSVRSADILFEYRRREHRLQRQTRWLCIVLRTRG